MSNALSPRSQRSVGNAYCALALQCSPRLQPWERKIETKQKPFQRFIDGKPLKWFGVFSYPYPWLKPWATNKNIKTRGAGFLLIEKIKQKRTTP
ncbi:MAG: hypothetical protein HY959_06090 [Ignavibacteriae bacterium]|nr:hypothetical protein [Ignavibacteriota bacterium]